MADDISLIINVKGVEDLRRAAEEFRRTGNVSRQLAAEYDAVAAKNLRVIKEARRLRALKKDLRREVKAYTDSNGKLGISQHKLVQIMKEEIRVSKEKVLTDKKFIAQEQKKAAAADRLERENRKLLSLYGPMTAAKQQYQKAIMDVDLALERNIITADEHAAAMRRLGFEFNQFTKGLATGGNQFAKFNVEAYKANQRMKRFASVGLQQAGYQVGDFAVQMQMGTNALVALGQQGSQLLGIFGAGGAIAGALLAVGTSIALVWQQASTATAKSIDDINGEIDKAFSSLEELKSIGSETSIDLQEKFGSAAGIIREMAAAAKEAATAIASIKVSEGLQKLVTPSLFGAGEAGDLGFGGGLASKFNPFRNIYELVKQGGLSNLSSEKLDEILQFGGDRIGSDTLKNLSEQLGGALNPDKIKEYFDALNGASPKEALQLLKDMQASIAAYPGFIEKASIEGLQFVTTLQSQAEALGLLVSNYEKLGKPATFKATVTEGTAQPEYLAQLQGGERERDQAFVASELKRVKGYWAERESLSRHYHDQEALLMEQSLTAGLELDEKKRAASIKRNVATFAQAENEMSAHYIATRNARFQEEADRIKARYDDEVNRAREAFAQMEEDRVNAHDEGVRRRLDNEQEIIDLQEKAEKIRDDLRNKSIAGEVKLLEANEEIVRSRRLEVQLAGEVAYQRVMSLAKTEQERKALEKIAREAELAAEEAVRLSHATEDAKDEAKELADALKEAEKAMERMSTFGESLQKRLAKAKAEALALKLGTDTTVAKDAAGLRFDAQQRYDDAFFDAVDFEGQKEAAALYAEQLKIIDELEKLGYLNAQTKDSLKDKSIKSTQDEIDKLREAIMVERTRIKVGEEEARQLEILQDLRRFNADADIKLTEKELKAAASKIAAAEAYNRRLKEQKDRYEELADFIGDEFENAFMSILDGTKSAKEAFRDMARAIVAELYKVLVIQRLVNAAKMAFPFANGGVFQNGNVVPFANGGVVGSPTYFPMSGGRTGLMGEAGPEAIMPLKRGKNGKLGVVAEGGGETVVVNNSFNFAANGDDSVKKIIAQSVPQITEAAKAGVLDARKRGGQFRKVFG